MTSSPITLLRTPYTVGEPFPSLFSEVSYATPGVVVTSPKAYPLGVVVGTDIRPAYGVEWTTDGSTWSASTGSWSITDKWIQVRGLSSPVTAGTVFHSVRLGVFSLYNIVTSANIVDVFVYDTSKDSDLGAWRFRCQSKSWYNETLNTATRGATREFPAVALIVAETTKVTIYDATVVGCPMWMVFQKGTASWLVGNMVLVDTTTPYVSCLNAQLSIANGALGIHVVNFLKDSHTAYSIAPSATNEYNGNISVRNSGLGYKQNTHGTAVVNSTVNDVAMCVIPNAPIGALTGLPVPTIAVATAGGVSIIDGPAGVGTVVDDVYTPVPAVQAVNIIGTTLSFAANNSWTTSDLANYLADAAHASTIAWEASRLGKWYYNVDPATHTIPAPMQAGTLQAKCSVSGKAFGGENGLTLLNENPSSYVNGMVAHITKDYNTGWMKGDIRRALICEALGTTVAVGATVPDRSVKATTLTKTGTLTYSPVATGASLQAISGFLGANYLSQAYSANLDFADTDFYVAGWIKEAPNSAIETIIERDSATTGARWTVDITAAGVLQFTTDDAVDTIVSSGPVIDDSVWRFFLGQVVSGSQQLYHNGALYDTDSAAAVGTLTNATATLRVGATCRTVPDLPLTNGSVALLRMGAGSLSAAQIEKMHADELPLFQPSAKCTLQGTSNVVKALSHDGQNSLFVGTGDGLTTFRGLSVDVRAGAAALTGDIRSVSAVNGSVLTGSSVDSKYSKTPSSLDFKVTT